MKQFLSLLVSVVAACGGASGDGTDEFVGTWTYQAGSTSKIDCDNNQLDRTSTETGAFAVSEGSDSDLVVDQLDSDDPCPAMKFDVNEGVATATAGQTCTRTTSGTMINITDQTMRATLDDAGSMTLSGTAKAAFSGTVTATCTLTITATAKK
jgi:hypothetical protein